MYQTKLRKYKNGEFDFPKTNQKEGEGVRGILGLQFSNKNLVPKMSIKCPFKNCFFFIC